MKIWLVNTNINEENGNPNGYKQMLRQNKAAAYYSRKETVDKIEPQDMVLLYHNNNRVIAVGFVINDEEHDFSDMNNVEHFVSVNWFWKADFNSNFEPTNSIDRNIIGIKMVNNTVVNITQQVDCRVLLQEIAKRQNYL
jgi:predicted Mrr-cat superfamily restriction endonuclease